MKLFLKISILFFLCFELMAQGENNIWYFSGNNGITFNTNNGEPVYIGDGKVQEFTEGVCTISDREGNLLFYSNGIKIWDKFHELMPNGMDLYGHSSIAQGVVIVPYPMKQNMFIVFTSGYSDLDNYEGLYYSIVDMSLRDGAGDVTSMKNVQLKDKIAEKMISVNGTCEKIWLIVQDPINKDYLSYEINSSGVQANPVVSTIFTDPGFNLSGISKLSSSPKGDKLLASNGSILHLLDYNQNSGVISNAKVLNEGLDYSYLAYVFLQVENLFMLEKGLLELVFFNITLNQMMLV